MHVWVVLDNKGIWSVCANKKLAEEEEKLAKENAEEEIRLGYLHEEPKIRKYYCGVIDH